MLRGFEAIFLDNFVKVGYYITRKQENMETLEHGAIEP